MNHRHIPVALLAAVTVASCAGGGGAGMPRSDLPTGDERYRGIVHMVPSTGTGFWHVGGRTFQSDDLTMIDTFEAPMAAGNCAWVHLRRDRAVQIVLVEAQDC